MIKKLRQKMPKSLQMPAARVLAIGTVMAYGGAFPLQAAAASPEFAYTEEKWASLRDNTIEFGELSDLIHKYNTTVQQNLLDYQDYRGKSSSEISQDYYDSAAKVSESIEYPDDDSSNYASQISSALSSYIQADNLTEQGDSNVDDQDTMKLTYDMEEAGLVQQAQELMITFHIQSRQLDSLKEAVTQAEAAYETVLAQSAAGMTTQSKIDSAAETVTSAKASLASAESSLAQTKDSLAILLGYSYGSDVTIGEVPAPDLEAINSIDLESDLEKALENNYSLQITALQISNARLSSTKESKQKTYDNQKETIASSVRSAYSSLILAKDSYEEALDSLALQESLLSAAQTQLAAGIITQNDYETQKYAAVNAEVAAQTQELSLLQAQLAYDWAVNGLASAS